MFSFCVLEGKGNCFFVASKIQVYDVLCWEDFDSSEICRVPLVERRKQKKNSFIHSFIAMAERENPWSNRMNDRTILLYISCFHSFFHSFVRSFID